MDDDFTKVEISKLDLDGKFLAGATLAIVLLDENGELKHREVFETWLTEDGAHIIERLPIGKYAIVELSAPEGYVKAEPVFIEIKDTGELQKFSITNKQLFVIKTDAVTGELLVDAKLFIVDKETNEVVYTWTTDGSKHFVSGLEEGRAYILKEEISPDGFYIADPVEFVVSAEKDIQMVEMKDVPVLTDILVNKIDSKTKESIVSKDFVFGIYSDKECKELIKKVSADKKNGTVTFEDLRFGTYYIKEIEAPNGYELSKEVKEIIVDGSLEGVGGAYEIEFENTPTPKVQTGDTTVVLPFVGLAIISLFGIVFLILKKKVIK
jgi:LPXTG-motif cell wall-anchored protein